MGNLGSQAFDQLKTVDLGAYSSYSQPICITQNNRKFIFIMPTRIQKYFKYDVESNKFLDLQKYPVSKPELIAHSSTIDNDNRHIYVLNGKHQLLMILDAKKVDNPWRVHKDFNVKCGPFPSVCYLTVPFDEFHTMSLGKHLVWDKTKKDFVQIYNIGEKLQHGAFIYVASKKQLILMGGIITAKGDAHTHTTYTYVDSIYVAEYSNIYEQWKWNKLKHMKLPHKMAKFGYVLYQDRYIILFGGEIAEKTFLNTIYMLDVDNYAASSIYQWILVDQSCPEQNIYFAVQNEDKIHLFQRRGNKQWAVDINKFTLQQRSLTMNNKPFEENELLNDEKAEIENTCTDKFIQSLQNEISAKDERIKMLENKLKCLLDEKKTHRQQMEVMEQAQQELIRNNKILQENYRKVSNKLIERSLYRYHEWNTEQVLYWILSLENGKFEKYQEMLSKNIKKYEMNGNDLSQIVNVYPIKKMLGITDVNDQNCLLNHIRWLCESNKDVEDFAQLPYSNKVEGAHGDILDIQTDK